MLARIDTGLLWLSRTLLLLSGVGLALMMVQTVADVVADNFWSRPIPGNFEIISVYHMVLVVFLPLAFVEWQHENIQVDMLWRLMPGWLQRAVLVLGYVVSAVFFAILARQTWFDAVKAMTKGEMMMGNVYVLIWPAKFVLPVGFAAIGLVSLRHAVHAALDPAFSPDPVDPGEGHI
ncbi:TRAP transporter small permease [Mangrovicoccus ximenensis]|uniref:TRAP transporter small permease n=1 Tax=Mangrovicoccus ximenensis TaxID=1911570 RepID=UPI000D3743AF|nr:TRAP transporter small permease [Mangrovicoccus ximenensis]